MSRRPPRGDEAQAASHDGAGDDQDALEFATVDDPDSADFTALSRLYEDALPSRERKSVGALRAMCADPDYHVVVARTSNRVAGFAIILAGRAMTLLEYMAVEASARGRGVGSALYRWARVNCAPADLPLIVEVDSDREPSDDRYFRTRRKQFYRRLGCREVVGLDYRLPLPGVEAPPQMDLLVDGAGATAPRDAVAAWLREIYRSAYGCKDDDSRLLAMIRYLPARIELA